MVYYPRSPRLEGFIQLLHRKPGSGALRHLDLTKRVVTFRIATLERHAGYADLCSTHGTGVGYEFTFGVVVRRFHQMINLNRDRLLVVLLIRCLLLVFNLNSVDNLGAGAMAERFTGLPHGRRVVAIVDHLERIGSAIILVNNHLLGTHGTYHGVGYAKKSHGLD